MTVDYLGFAYAATVAAGGVIGYVKAGTTEVVSRILSRTSKTDSSFPRPRVRTFGLRFGFYERLLLFRPPLIVSTSRL